MRGIRGTILVFLLGITLVIASSIVLAENIADIQNNCNEALTSFRIIDAFDCYSQLADAKIRESQVMYSQKKYDESLKLAKSAMNIHSMSGFCFNTHGCGGAATAAAIASAAREAMGDHNNAMNYAKVSVGYAKASGQCYVDNPTGDENIEKANTLCAILYYYSTVSRLSNMPEIRQDEKNCTLLSGSGSIKNLDILYVGHGFTNITEFQKFVDESYHTLLSFKPFSELTSKINIRRLDELTNFDCTTIEPRMINCNNNKVNAKRTATCPSDKVIIVVKRNDWRGAGDINGEFVTLSSWQDMPKTTIVHEFAHALGLNDEYTYDPGFNMNMARSPNCIPDPTCAKFQAEGVNVCLQGCSYNAYYRSIADGMMRILGEPFGTFDENYIKKKVGAFG